MIEAACEQRAHLRTETADPIETISKTDRLPPVPQNDRMLMEDPKFSPPITDSFAPATTRIIMDIPDPTLPTLLTENELDAARYPPTESRPPA
jgi:hypothetical protein